MTGYYYDAMYRRPSIAIHKTTTSYEETVPLISFHHENAKARKPERERFFASSRLFLPFALSRFRDQKTVRHSVVVLGAVHPPHTGTNVTGTFGEFHDLDKPAGIGEYSGHAPR
jgi:hypothetical protein